MPFSLTISSSDQNLNDRLRDAESLGFPIHVLWSAYDQAFLSFCNISPETAPCK